MSPDQKQLGIHNTREDISEYIAKNTIIPFLLDATKKKCPAAFEPGGPVWRLLREHPDRYIYQAIRNENYLPIEAEQEYTARRKYYAEIKGMLAAGEIVAIHDLITYNLDIGKFAQDVITSCDEPDLLQALYKNIKQITILDPACGSGAFLLAALNVLEPLYEGCLERIDRLTSGHDLPQPYTLAAAYASNQETENSIGDLCGHPTESCLGTQDINNRRYFILKSIISNNLYGVDIVKEAVEICKLRLLLNLIAQIGSIDDSKSLPNIDRNIRVGNTLIGFTNSAQADCYGNAGRTLLGRQACHEKLDCVLAGQYGIDPQNASEFEQWLSSQQPFHWYVEFDNVMQNGGFDVIIGNPPYVEYSEVKANYRILPNTYKTAACGNLYAYFIERSIELLKDDGRWGMIVPLSAFSTDRMRSLQQLVMERSSYLHLCFLSGDANPSRLFEGVKFRLCIGLASSSPQRNAVERVSILRGSKGKFTYYSTRYLRWYAEERDMLFHYLKYTESTDAIIQGSWPKIGQDIELAILKIMSAQPSLRSFMNHGDDPLYYHSCPVNWIRATTFVPRFCSDRDGMKVSSQIRQVRFQNDGQRDAAVCIINSTLFFWFWLIYSDCYHLTEREIGGFPINLNELTLQQGELLSRLSSDLMDDYKKNSKQRTYVYKTTGRVVYDEFYPKLSKPIIDEIDRVLAQYYRLDANELGFILNYEEKYRMGKTSHRK